MLTDIPEQNKASWLQSKEKEKRQKGILFAIDYSKILHQEKLQKKLRI